MKKKTRKALDCKLIGQSEIDPNYFKYEVTIQEPNGDVYKAPAFGRDMQDALSRLVWTERTEAVSKFADKKPWLKVIPMLSLFCVLGIFAIQSTSHDDHIWFLVGLATLGAIIGVSILWSKHLDKR
tara:strand:+ start:120 stop:497 length:378 start_codon:yes stop_codon:yes gene_type:complete